MKTRTKSLTASLLGLTLAAAVDAATIVVTSHGDQDAADGECSLREAILAANGDAPRHDCPAGNGPDRILLDLSVPRVIELTADLPTVTESLAVRATSGTKVIVYGQELHRMFVVDSPGNDQWFLVEDLILAGGYHSATTGGGAAVALSPGDDAVLSRSAFFGNVAEATAGAVHVVGSTSTPTTLEVIDCDFQANESRGPAGAGALFAGFASFVRVRGSSFWDNHAASLGGALYVNRGELIVESSTISGNSSDSYGGGIAAHTATGSATLRVFDSTVTLNEADADGSGAGEGGGIAFVINSGQPATLEIRNSIVAGNLDDPSSSHPDLWLPAGLTVAGSGWNLLGANDGGSAYFVAGAPNAAGDFVGTAASPIDPLLEALDYNAEGFTATHRPLLSAASPVIDHGACPGRTGDQLGRGEAGTGLRIVQHPVVVDHAASDGCDIGAFERGADPNVVAELFADGFELGHTLRWDAEAP